jgi:hypothetical protein
MVCVKVHYQRISLEGIRFRTGYSRISNDAINSPLCFVECAKTNKNEEETSDNNEGKYENIRRKECLGHSRLSWRR